MAQDSKERKKKQKRKKEVIIEIDLRLLKSDLRKSIKRFPNSGGGLCPPQTPAQQ